MKKADKDVYHHFINSLDKTKLALIYECSSNETKKINANNHTTHLEFSSSVICLILRLVLSDFSALAHAGCLADDLKNSSCFQKRRVKF